MSFDARPPVRRLAAVLSVSALALVGLVVASPGSPGAAGTADEATLASLVNGARAAAGLPALTVSDALSATARSHSAAMAAAGRLFHTGDLAGAIGDAVAWTDIAENVAVAGSVTEAHQALMASSVHRAHVLGDYTLLGVGVVSGGDGRVWVTEHFAKAAAAPAPAPAPAPEETSTVAEVESTPVVEPAPAPAPAPAPKVRTAAVRPARTTAAVASTPVGPEDESCLPPQTDGHGQGYAYGRCPDFTSNGQGGR